MLASMRLTGKCGIRRDVQELKIADLVAIGMSLKEERISSLELYIEHDAKPRYTFLSNRHAEAMLNFSRSLAWSVSTGGRLQRLELSFSLSRRDLQLLVHALSLSKTLKHLSFANSCMGDANMQLLSRGVRDCTSLEYLSLAGCSLTDAAAPILSSILKANLSRKIQEDWQNSLRDYKQKEMNCRHGLRALDLSFNKLSGVSMKAICKILRLGPSIEGLDVRGNKLEFETRNLFQDIMKEWNILKFVDLRQNEEYSLGVLGENKSFLPFNEWDKQCSIVKKKRRGTRCSKARKDKDNRKAERFSARSMHLGRPTPGQVKEFSISSSINMSISSRGTFLYEVEEPSIEVSPVTPATPATISIEEQSPSNYTWCENELMASTNEELSGSKMVFNKQDREWSGFLTDISKALLQLNDRLDNLIGPSGASNELRSQLLSKLSLLD